MASWSGTYHNLFDVAGNAVSVLLRYIPAANDDDRDNQVCKALRVTSAVYKTQLSNNFVRIDWTDPVYQCAYVFLYFAKHSHLVYETMFYNAPLYFEAAWRRNKDIKVCSIGGGPGSDIAGIVAFLEGTNFGLILQCSVLDLYPEWHCSWKAIQQNLPSRLHLINARYHKFDLKKPPPFTAAVLDSIRNADLVTFVKSFSTVSTEQLVYLRVLPAIMDDLKTGAFVLLIDNLAAEVQTNLFIQIALQAGLVILQDIVHDATLSLPSSNNIEMYNRRFNYKPLRSCSVRICLMRKPLMCPAVQSWQLPTASSAVHRPMQPSQDLVWQTQTNSTANSWTRQDVPTCANLMGVPIYTSTYISSSHQMQPLESNLTNQTSLQEQIPKITMLHKGDTIPSITPSSGQKPVESLACEEQKLNNISKTRVHSGCLLQSLKHRTRSDSSSSSSTSLSSSSSSSLSSSSQYMTDGHSPIPWEDIGIAIITVFVIFIAVFT